MGAGQSSIARYTNDFELVIRATKELEYLLETHFLPPLSTSQDKTIGLHDKISMARLPDGQPLPPAVVKKMRYLVTLRNKLVHDCNAIPDRPAFVRQFVEVETMLKKRWRCSAGTSTRRCCRCSASASSLRCAASSIL